MFCVPCFIASTIGEGCWEETASAPVTCLTTLFPNSPDSCLAACAAFFARSWVLFTVFLKGSINLIFTFLFARTMPPLMLSHRRTPSQHPLEFPYQAG